MMLFDLSNRETAILIIITLFLGFMMRYPSVRSSIASLVRCALSWKLVAATTLAWLWIAVGVSILSKLGLWEIKYLKETVLWAAFSGTLIAFRGLNAEDPISQFRAVLTEQLKWTTLIVFYSNWESLSLFWELCLIPVLALLGASLAVAESDKKLNPAITPIKGIASLIGLVLLVYVSVKVFQQPDRFFTFDSLVILGLPFALAIWTIPFGYVFSLIGAYELLIIHLRIGNDQPRDLRFYSILKALELGHVNATKVRRINKLMASKATWAKSHEELDNLYESLRETMLDPDNKESRDFMWPEPPLYEGEIRYNSIDEYLQEANPILDLLIELWESTVKEFSHTSGEGTVPHKLESFLTKRWPEVDAIYQRTNEMNHAPKEGERFDRELQGFSSDLHNIYWFYSPENTSITEPPRRGYLVLSGYRSAEKQFQRLMLATKKLCASHQAS